MQYTYAQLNDTGICIGESILSAEVDSPLLIPIDSADGSHIGKRWNDGEWEVVAAPPAPPDPTEWLLDVGPFFDRFGASKLAVLSHTDPLVQALVKDLQVRKWIDLKRADVAQGIDLLISKSIPGVNAALKAAILTTPVASDENLALRKIYFQ